VVAVAGDYSADLVAYDTDLQLVNSGTVKAALDELYEASVYGDRVVRVTNDDFVSGLYVNAGTPAVLALGGTTAAALTNVALSTGAFEWQAGAGVSLLRESPPGNSSFCGLWTIRVNASAAGTIATRAVIATGANNKCRVAARLQLLPTAQVTRLGFFDAAQSNQCCVEFHTLGSSVFQMRFLNSKAGVSATQVIPFNTVNEGMSVIYTVDRIARVQRVTLRNEAGNLIGPIYESTFADINAPTAQMNAGVYSAGVGSAANTPTVRVDYLEVGIR
jgi:hypothetical protein